MKKKLFLCSVLLLGCCLSAYAFSTILGTGTAVKNAAYTVSFSHTIKHKLLLNNRTAAVVYVALDDRASSVSATVYDLALDQNETIVIDDINGINKIGVFCASTTPTLQVSGW